jgi:hypothetical protein
MPRGNRVQRRILTLALMVAVGSTALPFSVPASLAATSVAASADRDAALGEPGSGPPPAPDRIPAAALERSGSVKWSDVRAGHWARTAINYVGSTYGWMRDYPKNGNGTYDFKPDRLETRKLFARALVKAFAPTAEVDQNITFDDLSTDSAYYRYANVAVQKGWLRRTDGGASFSPGSAVTTRTVHQALVLALGLRSEAAGLDHLHTANGVKFSTPPKFGTLLIGMRLGLRYNHSNESLDVGPDTPLPRSEVAWSLYQAKTLSSYEIGSMEPYANIELPSIGPQVQALVQWGVRFVGYPYVWGGEWSKKSPPGYGFGYQPIGGFDCSGLTWWNLKAAGGGWDNRPPRPYAGWSLPQRTSADMARYGKVRFRHLEPGDLMLYDGDRDGTVDHVDTFIGNGWSLDSGGSNAGVTITFTGAGSWYQDHFVHGRRIIK